MPKFNFHFEVTTVTYFSLEIEANTKEEALEIWEDTDVPNPSCLEHQEDLTDLRLTEIEEVQSNA